jgi:hypothetical protein
MIGRMQSDTAQTPVWAPLGTKPAQHDFRHQLGHDGDFCVLDREAAPSRAELRLLICLLPW